MIQSKSKCLLCKKILLSPKTFCQNCVVNHRPCILQMCALVKPNKSVKIEKSKERWEKVKAFLGENIILELDEFLEYSEEISNCMKGEEIKRKMAVEIRNSMKKVISKGFKNFEGCLENAGFQTKKIVDNMSEIKNQIRQLDNTEITQKIFAQLFTYLNDKMFSIQNNQQKLKQVNEGAVTIESKPIELEDEPGKLNRGQKG